MGEAGVSESARATTAQEAAFRVPYANSTPRRARLVALDQASEGLVRHLARGGAGRSALSLWSERDAAEARALVDSLAPTDLVVLVSTGGADSPAAQLIAEACRLRRVPVLVFVLDTPARAGELPQILGHLRPYASMLVRAADAAYVADMLTALRA